MFKEYKVRKFHWISDMVCTHPLTVRIPARIPRVHCPLAR